MLLNENFTYIHDAETESEIWDRFFGHMQKNYGFTSMLYAFSHSFYTTKRLGLTKSLFIKQNHPKDYVEYIGSDNFLNNDLCVAAVVESNEPFLWHTAFDHPNATDLQRKQALVDKRFGMDIGVSFALPFANGRGIGGLGLCMGQSTVVGFMHIWDNQQLQITQEVRRFDALMRPAIVRNRLRLSSREREILAYSAGGMIAKEIAAHLGLKPKTIYNTLERARASMQAASTMEAVAKAYIYDLI